MTDSSNTPEPTAPGAQRSGAADPGVAQPDTARAETTHVDAAPAQDHAVRSEAQGSEAKTVVVAEDEALIRMDIVEMLEDAGYRVVAQAENGELAVALASEHRPDLVLMDVKMPVMDGITAAEQIAQDRIAPVVLLTAFSQRELVERAREAGAMAYVVKPFTVDDVVPAIEIAMSRFEEITALESEVADMKEQFATRKLVERAKSLLQTKMGLSEPEAFRWIQKTSMDRRLSMREVAEAIISQVA
ncbi:ANTAR domain-containing response regulator [Kocuria sp. CPCC 204721]|uniref:ANTAR domain-containing response regulator n=1 Tax=Kocuria sp. CPCC 204721 TaxID=3073548 RepID=UPI0034D5BF42